MTLHASPPRADDRIRIMNGSRVAVIVSLFLMLVPRPAFGFFEIFEQLKQEIRTIEQSKQGEDRDAVVRTLDTAGKFNDVGEKDWFYQYVSSTARWGIVSGYKNAAGKSTGTYGAGNTVTVAEILKMALKAAQADETACSGTPGFAQAETHWARAFVLCAQEKKMRLIASRPDLNRPALRGEVLSVVFDAFGDTVPPLFAPFKDAENHPLESDIAYAAALRMVNGDRDGSGLPLGTFRPNAAVNRAEAAKIIYERLRVEVMERQK